MSQKISPSISIFVKFEDETLIELNNLANEFIEDIKKSNSKINIKSIVDPKDEIKIQHKFPFLKFEVNKNIKFK